MSIEHDKSKNTKQNVIELPVAHRQWLHISVLHPTVHMVLIAFLSCPVGIYSLCVVKGDSMRSI